MLRRSLILTSVAAAFGAGALVPVLLVSAGAAPTACPAWTDPQGDATTAEEPVNPNNSFGDSNLDLVSVSLTTTATDVTAVLKVDKLNAVASDAGDRFNLDFTAGGKDLELYAERGYTTPAGTTLPGTVAGVYNSTDAGDGVGKAVATYDLTANTVTIKAKVADVSSVAGVAVSGKPMTAINAMTQDYVTGVEGGFVYDEAATTLPVTLGVACDSKGGATVTPTPTPTPTATQPAPAPSGDPMKQFPRAGCSTINDPKGDGTIAGEGPDDPDLDITSLTLRSTSTDLLGYIRVDKLAAGPSTTDGHRYAIDFTFNTHVFTMSATTSAHGTNAIRDAAATSGLVGKSIQLGVDAPSTTAVPPPTNRGLVASGLKATFDTTNSIVVFSLPIADVVKYGGAPLSGKLTAVDAKSQIETNVLSVLADTAPDANGTTWTVGDNKCFSVPTQLKLAIAKKGAARIVTATLAAVGGAPLAGQTISFAVNGKPAGKAVTSAKGVATFKAAKAGQTVVAMFAGASGYDPSKATARA